LGRQGLKKDPLIRLDVDINKRKQKKNEHSGAATDRKKNANGKISKLQSMDAGALSTTGPGF
jgi:hypothetical protein